MDPIHNPIPIPAAAKATVNKVLAHVSLVGSKLVSVLSGLMAACMILYSGYVLYDTAYTQTTAGNTWELLQYRPDIIDDGATPISGNLSEINEDYRAWLTVYDTNIDYPVMQGENDLYYASHDIYGEVSLTGAIYLAYANRPNMNDTYNLVYGHHMDNGAMFGALDSYLNEAYAQSHREGVIVSSSGVYNLTLFAVAKTDAYEGEIYSVGNRKDALLSFLRSPGASTEVTYFDEDVAGRTTRVLALSTCASADTNGRLVVFFRMSLRDLITLEATGYGDVYDAMPHGLSSVTTNYPEGTLIEYSVDDGDHWITDPPTLTNVGTLTVMIRATHPEYGTEIVTETIQIIPRPLIIAAHEATKAVGDEDPSFTATVTGLVDDFEPVYTLSRPRAGIDEEVGEYADAIVPAGEELQGNYSVTYVPARFTITPVTVVVEADVPILRYFDPAGVGASGPSWALVNLICTILTVYLFLPVMNLRDKYGRRNKMNRCDELWDGESELNYEVKRFTRRFRIGVSSELADSVLAIVVFILTEDIRTPMVLIDRWTPLMILFLAICWVVDVRLIRYRGKPKEKEEDDEAPPGMQNTQSKNIAEATQEETHIKL